MITMKTRLEKKLSECKFNPIEHIYTIDGVTVPSVTGLISEFGLSNSEWYGLQAKYRGSHVHTATQYYDEGDLDILSLDDTIKPFVEAYIKFKSEIKGLEYTLIETSLYDVDYKFAGTFDRYGALNGEPILLDIKTGSAPKWANVQLAGYRHLILKNKLPCPTKYYILVLKVDGTYKLNQISTYEIFKGQYAFDVILSMKKLQLMYK